MEIPQYYKESSLDPNCGIICLRMALGAYKVIKSQEEMYLLKYILWNIETGLRNVKKLNTQGVYRNETQPIHL